MRRLGLFDFKAVWERALDQPAREEIAQSEVDHDDQPNEPGGGEKPGLAAAVADMHEKENDEQHFHDGNRERDDRVPFTQVDLSDGPGGKQQK